MAVTQRVANSNLRASYANMFLDLLANSGEDVGRVSAGVINFPVVDENGNESWIEVTIKVPTGSRDGTPYDGYELREDYLIKHQVEIVPTFACTVEIHNHGQFFTFRAVGDIF